MISLLLLVLAAPPAPPPPPGEIGAPLGHFGAVVAEAPSGGASEADRAVVPTWAGCAPQGVYLVRMIAGTVRALEQLQQSLDAAKGAEKRLFARKAVLTEVLRHVSAATFEAKSGCKPAALADGARLELVAPPKKWCAAQPDAQDGEFWFFTKGKPAVVVSVQPGAEATACKPRVSLVAFDARGAARVRLHADWGGAMSATLVGDRCQTVDYAFDPGGQVFVPSWKSCKR